MKFTIPETEDKIGLALNEEGLKEQIVGWKRAAMVAALVEDKDNKQPGGAAVRQHPRPYGFMEFARKKYTGLKTYRQVKHYYDAWQMAIAADKAVEVWPGDTIELPDMDWPPTEPAEDVQKRVTTSTLAARPEKMIEEAYRKAIEKGTAESFVESVTKQVMQAPLLHSKVVQQVHKEDADRIKNAPTISWTPPPKDWEQDAIRGIAFLFHALSESKSGTWAPDGALLIALRALSKYINEFLDSDIEATPSLWDEIDGYLKKEQVK